MFANKLGGADNTGVYRLWDKSLFEAKLESYPKWIRKIAERDSFKVLDARNLQNPIMQEVIDCKLFSIVNYDIKIQ